MAFFAPLLLIEAFEAIAAAEVAVEAITAAEVAVPALIETATVATETSAGVGLVTAGEAAGTLAVEGGIASEGAAGLAPATQSLLTMEGAEAVATFGQDLKAVPTAINGTIDSAQPVLRTAWQRVTDAIAKGQFKSARDYAWDFRKMIVDSKDAKGIEELTAALKKVDTHWDVAGLKDLPLKA
ncbi:hypothetical protein SCHPADRAFT_298516 [Schizopora paradoxa]|uniref:Uncharacterized protein n=1 Tax=Schizopora paradoxa TaxID=27342 RepID=A0A0H2RT06_9AGAM|nr:hypothetical protein SCHPADRAFT_298516 [Schizopora paradoxa]